MKKEAGAEEKMVSGGTDKKRGCAVIERGKFEDPLTIALQSRDDFFWGTFSCENVG